MKFLLIYVPNLRFREFNEKLVYTSFENVIRLYRGSSPRPIINYITTGENGVNWIKIGDMPSTGNRVFSCSERITKEGSKKSRAVYKGDIILSNSMSFGKPYILEIDGFIHDGWFVVRDYQNYIDKTYLCQLLSSDVVQNQYKSTAAGGVVKNISSDLVNSVKFHLPSIMEQRKIAKFLELIDKKIETQIKIIELKQSLIKDIEDKILWKSPNTHSRPIREFLTEVNDKSTIQNQYPLLSSTKKGLFLQTDYFNKEAASSNNIGYKIVHKGDIIISPQNLWMGNITYNDKFDNGLVSPSYRIYKVKEEYNTFYISRILMSYRALSLYKNISEQGASIVRRNLNVDAFNELCFPIPDIKKQDEVGLFLSKLHQELNYETWILIQLKSQKNYLLNNMFI